jgi:hypothetical protein
VIANRRGALSAFAGFFAGLCVAGATPVDAGQRRPIRRTRRARRLVRRRIRRRVIFRTVAGRRVLVAPVALAVGWELALDDNRVVVVKETKFVERNGARVEVAVVATADGKTEEIEFIREDTPDNAKNLEGSILPDADKTTPAVEKEEEVEVDQ